MSFTTDLLRAIAQNPGAPIEELAASLRADAKKVRNNIHQLTHQHLISRKMDDVTHQPGYRLTEAGKAKLCLSHR